MSAARDRLALGRAAVLSVSEAARLLPWRTSQARAWIRERGLVIEAPGVPPVVLWGAILDALNGCAEAPSPERSSTRAGAREWKRSGKL